ncbi:serine protease [candidate division KSB1 bacterium]|nr:serine protease [candidate division KSB1 bacterium]
MIKKNSRIVPWLVALALGFIFFSRVTSQAQTRSASIKKEALPDMPAKVYEKVAPATVKIFCDQGRKTGSGVIIGVTEKGRVLILTACHVVATNFGETDPDIGLEFYKDIVIKTNTDVKPVRAGVLPSFVDRTNDLALLTTTEPVAVKKVISYNRTDKINPGAKVAAFGYPQSDKLSQTVGRITRLESKYLVFDAKISPGNSGGPLVDKHGRMIGVSTFVEGGKDGYAVNIDLVLSVVEKWFRGVKLKARWEYQKYGTTTERIYKDWRFIAGETLLVGGGLFASGVLANNKDGTTNADLFPKPQGRPDGN